MTITTLTGQTGTFPGVPAGARAAAVAVNRTCELGRPVQIVSCDDHFNPNEAAACSRRAVADSVLAIAMAVTGVGDGMMPVLTKAGIASFNAGTSQSENLATNSFPLSLSLPEVIGSASGMAATGAKKVAIAYVDLPSAQFVVDQFSRQAEKVGMTVVGNVPLPPTATDMTQYAAQIVSSRADAFTILAGGPQIAGIIRGLQQQSADLNRLKLFLPAVTNSPTVLSSYPGEGEGIYLFGNTWPADDSTNPGIRKYRAELRAAGLDSPENLGEPGVLAWTSVHNIVSLLKGGPLDAATLLAKMKAAKINEPQIAPFDFSVNAFPNDPVLKNLRMFSGRVFFSRFVNGRLVPLTNGFVDELTVPRLIRAG